MDACINWVRAMFEEGFDSPTQTRLAEPYLTALRDSEVFSGDSPLLSDPGILALPNPDESNLVVLVHGGEDYRAVLSA